MSNYEKLRENEETRKKLEDNNDGADFIANLEFNVKNEKTGQEGYAETHLSDKVCFVVPDEGMTEHYVSIEEFNRDFIARKWCGM